MTVYDRETGLKPLCGISLRSNGVMNTLTGEWQQGAAGGHQREGRSGDALSAIGQSGHRPFVREGGHCLTSSCADGWPSPLHNARRDDDQRLRIRGETPLRDNRNGHARRGHSAQTWEQVAHATTRRRHHHRQGTPARPQWSTDRQTPQ